MSIRRSKNTSPGEFRRLTPEQRKRRARKAKIIDGVLAVGLVIAVALAVIAVIAAVVAFGGLIVWLAWNYGVVAIVAACGGSVSKIGFGAACGAYLVLALIKQFIRPSQTVTNAVNKAGSKA